MSLEYAQELRHERAGLAKQLTDLAKLTADEKRDFTPEEAAKFDEIEKRCTELETQFLRLEKADKERAAVDARGERAEHRRWVDKQVSNIDEDVPTAADMDLAFRGWLMAGAGIVPENMQIAMHRCGVSGATKQFDHGIPPLRYRDGKLPTNKADVRTAIREARALARDQVITRATTAQSITTTGGGNVIGNDNSLIDTIFSSMLTGGAMRSVATVYQTDTGATLPIPIDDNRDKGILVGINTALTTANLTFAQVTLSALKYGSQVLLPIELIQDSAIDIQSFTGERLGERLKRILEEHLATGASSLSEPVGIVTTGTSGGAQAGTTASSQAVTVTDLNNVVASIDNAYLGGASWMMHQSLRSHIAGLLDADGRPLWQPSLTAGAGDMLLGYPVVINNEFVAYTNSSAQTAADKIATFGRHDHYAIRDVMNINVRRLDERYAELGQVGVIAFSRHDGKYINVATTNTTNASIKTLLAAAS